MAKTIREKKLVFLDFRKEEYKFFHIEALSIGYDDIQVIYRYGNLGNKGREKIERFKSEGAFKKAMKLYYRKVYDKKSEGYISVGKMEEGLKYAIKRENQDVWRAKQKTKQALKCNICKTPLNPKLFEKINKWGRNEGNWDYSQKSPLYKKVACLECQIEQDIFQKKIDEDTVIHFS